MNRSPFLRRLARAAWDCLSWASATLIVVGSRHDFALNQVLWSGIARYVLCACLLQLAAGAFFMLYLGRYRTGSFEESWGLARACCLAGILLAVAFIGLVDVGTFPRATAVLAPSVALLMMVAGRLGYRVWRVRNAPLPDAEKVLIYGAGDAGYQLHGQHKRHPAICHLPVEPLSARAVQRHPGNRYVVDTPLIDAGRSGTPAG